MSKAHPFEISGDRVGPFKLVSVISTPSRNLAEHNPRGYNNAVQQCWSEATSFKVVLHQCSHCGQGLTHNAVIRDSLGHHFVVGLDCASKVGDASLGDSAKIELARIKREADQKKREAKREANHQKWLNQKCHTGETNRVRLERESQERTDQLKRAKALNQKRAEIFEPIANVLRDGKNGFRDSVAEGLSRGVAPSGSGLFIACEIFAKAFGRRASNNFKKSFSEAKNIFQRAELLSV